MKTQQRGLQSVANALLAEVRAAVSAVLALLEMCRLKLSSSAASFPACSAGITQVFPPTALLPSQSSETRHLTGTLTPNPDTVFKVHFVCVASSNYLSVF